MAAAAPGSRSARPLRLLPEPERLWVRFAPRSWPGAPLEPVRWLDLAAGRLGSPGSGGADGALALPPGPFDDVLYLPPVAGPFRTVRDRAAARVLADGTPVLIQVLPGEPPPESTGTPGALVVVDLLDALLAEDLERLAAVPAGAVAAWPLLAGVTDRSALVEEGVARLARAGIAAVQGLVPDLPPVDRRSLAEGRDESVFHSLFHGAAPDPRPLARAVAGHGMEPFLGRPLPRPPLAGAPGRELAGLLLLAGELCQRLGRHGRGQQHFRAGRWVDRTRYDLRVLAAEGNLPVIERIDPASRRIVEEWAETGRSATVDALVEEYLAPAPEGEPAAAPGHDERRPEG